MTVAIKKKIDSDEAEEFRNLALKYAQIGADEGVRIIPFISPEMPLYHKASAEERKTATDYLKTVVDIHEETIASGEKAINSKQLIWRALRKFSLVPSPDIFDKLTDDDAVVVYQGNLTVAFWNLQFFKYISLSVEQLFFCLWHELTTRDPQVQEKIQEMVMNIISGKLTRTFVPDIPGHEVQEVGTLECIRTWMELPYASVLTKDGNFGGAILVQKMRII